MSTRINTNVDAFGAQRNMALNAMSYSKSLLDGGLNTSISSGSSVKVGMQLSTSAGGVAISNLDVSNATASHSFTFTSSGSNLTLTDTTTNLSQTIAVTDITNLTSANEVLDFSSL